MKGRKEKTIQDMHQHVMGLCSQHNIVFTWCCRPSQAWAAREIEEVYIPPVKSVISYATALHEIGHILGRFQRSGNSVIRERWAWQWAKRNALIWTPAMNWYAAAMMSPTARPRRTA